MRFDIGNVRIELGSFDFFEACLDIIVYEYSDSALLVDNE
jgi:hypothetical protein